MSVSGSLFSLCILTVFFFGFKSEPNKQKRPNIIFAFADDWGKYASCYAKVENNKAWQHLINTPNVDRIANDGILFNNAFVNSPSCTPCRSSLLSGQHFYRTGRGAILRGAVWDDNIPTYPLILEENGYHIGYTYKVWSPGKPENAGYGGERTKYEVGGNRFNSFSQNVSRMLKVGQSLEEAKNELYKEVRQNFNSFLNANSGNKSYCYWWGPKNTHRSWVKGSGKKFWGINPDSLKGKLPPFLPDEHIVRQDFSDYLGEVMAFDAGLGVLIEMLEERGELNNTIIVVSGDHGIPGFTHGKCNLYDFGTNVTLAVRWPSVITPGRVVDDLVSLVDLAPTFLDVANVAIPEVMTGKSLLPLLESNKSNGIVKQKNDWIITGRERHVESARDGNLPYPQRAIRTKEFLYIINFKPDRWPMGNPEEPNVNIKEVEKKTRTCFADYDAGPTKAWIVKNKNTDDNYKYYKFAFAKRPKEELYHITNDPYQINNLANNQDYQTTKHHLRKQLIEELEKTKDPRVTGNGQTFDKPPYAGK